MSILEIILRAKNEMSPGVNAATGDIKALHNALTEVLSAKFDDKASPLKDLEQASNRTRGVMVAAGSAARAFGVDIASVTGPVAIVSNAVGDLAAAFEGLNKKQMLLLGGLGIAGVAAGIVVSKLQAQHDALVKTISSSDAYMRSMKGIAQVNAEAAGTFDLIANNLAIMREMGSGNPLTKIFGSFGAAHTQIADFFAGLDEGVVRFRSMGEITDEYKAKLAELEAQHYKNQYAAAAFNAELEKLKALDPKLDFPAQQVDPYALALAQGEGIVNRYKEGTLSLSEAVSLLNSVFGLTKEQVDALRLSMLGLNEVAETSATTADRVRGRWSAYERELAARLPVTFDVAKDKYAAWQTALKDTSGYDKAKAAAQRLRDAVRGVVEQQLTIPSFDEHKKKVEAGGKDVWESIFRLDAVATGTDPAAYGKQFEDSFSWLKTIGYDAKTAAAAMRDFSLFADPANIAKAFETGLVDLDALMPQIESAINGVIGKANLLDEAFARVWAGLSQQKKVDLAKAFGIEGATVSNIEGFKDTLQDGITDPAGKATQQVGGLGSAIKGVPTSVNTVFSVAKNESFDNDLAEILSALSKIPTSINVAVGLSNGIPNGAAGGSTDVPPDNRRASGGYVGRGLYQLGEAGREYVLPHGMVKYIESVLGGPIRDPRQIEWLIGALGKGPAEAAAAVQTWASGMAGWGVDAPEKTDKWLGKIYDRYEKQHGADGLPTGARSSGGGSAGGDGAGGMTVNVSLLDVDADKIAQAIVKALAPHLIDVNERSLIDRLSRAISKQLGASANRRAAGRI